MVKKVKKQSWLHLAALITIGIGLTGLVLQNNLSAAQLNQKAPRPAPFKIKLWFGGVKKRLASIMHGIIKQLKKIKKKTDLHMKKVESNMKQIDSNMKRIDSNMKRMKFDMDTLNLKAHGLGKK